MSEAERGRYWAYISHANKDAAVAAKLHAAIEKYRIPKDLVGRPGRDGPVPKRLTPVFSNHGVREDSDELGEETRETLRRSRHLIVICSEASAVSKRVHEEIRYFKFTGGADRILALIVDGEPNASTQSAPVAGECFTARNLLLADGH